MPSSSYPPQVHTHMERVLAMLAAASSDVLPDPKVAAIVLGHDGRAISSYSKGRFGEPHSEAMVVLRAFESVLRHRTHSQQASELLQTFRHQLRSPGSIRGPGDLETLRALTRELGDPLKNATLMVNLEPCSHFGKNPACAAIIAAAGIRTAHFAHFDPDPDVQGNGFQMLKDAGVACSVGCKGDEAMNLNKPFLAIASFLPRLFGGIHPTANPKERPHVMLGLLVPPFTVRSQNLGKKVEVNTHGVPPRRTTIIDAPGRGRPRSAIGTISKVPYDPDAILFTTLLNPPAIIEMVRRKFQVRPGHIIAAVPDMSYELGKTDCISMIREYCPDTHICVGVRMAAIQDKLARISLRRRLMVERNKQGTVAVVIMAKGIPPDQGQVVETRYLELVGATTLHISRLEEYLTMLKFLRDNIKVTIYLAGDVFAEKWRARTIRDLRKLLEGRPHFDLRCTEEEAVAGLKDARIPRVSYLEPYWELV